MKNLITAFALTALTAVVSNPVFAKGPFGDQEQIVVTPPLFGELHAISFVNKSSEDIDYVANCYDDTGNVVAQRTDTLAPGFIGFAGLGDPGARFRYCDVSWIGHRSDLIVSFCSSNTSSPIEYQSCINVN